MLMLEGVVIFLTLVLFIGEKEQDTHWYALNGALVGTIILMFALNFATICRGLNWCFSCGTDTPESSNAEEKAKEAVAQYRWIKAGNKGKPPKSFFSFGDQYNVNLKDFTDPEEQSLFFNLETPGEIANAANEASRRLLNQRNEERKAIIRENVGKAVQPKPQPKPMDDKFRQALGKIRAQSDDMYKIKPKEAKEDRD